MELIVLIFVGVSIATFATGAIYGYAQGYKDGNKGVKDEKFFN